MEDLKSERDQLAKLESLRQEKKYKEFFKTAEETINYFPDSYPVRFLYAEALIENKRLNEAESVLKELMLNYPDNINLLLEFGKLTFKLEKYDEAGECFNKILFLDPFNDQAKELLVKIGKIEESKTGQEQEGKPLDFITYTKEKEKEKEIVTGGQPGEQPPPARSEVDTTPFTAATKPEDEIKVEVPSEYEIPSLPDLEQAPPVSPPPAKKPDLDTKKVVFEGASTGEQEQPPPIPAAPDVGKKEIAGLEFDIPEITDTEKEIEGDKGAAQPVMEFDIPSLQEPVQPPPIPPSEQAVQPPPIPADREAGKKEIAGLEFDIPSITDEEPETYKDKAEETVTARPDMEFDIPSLGEQEPPPAPEPDLDTKKVEYFQEPEAVKREVEAGIPGKPAPVMEEAEKEFDIPSTREEEEGKRDMEYEIPAMQDMESEFSPAGEEESPPPTPAAGTEAGSPFNGEQGPEITEEDSGSIEFEYEIPDREPEQTMPETVADTIVEMEAPAVPELEQGPAIPPPTAAAAPTGLEDEIPSARGADREEIEIEYEIPARAGTDNGTDIEFEIPADRESSQDEIEVEYEIPSQEPITPAVDEGFEIPAAGETDRQEERFSYEIPAAEPGTPVEVEHNIPPAAKTEAEKIDAEIDRVELEMSPAPEPEPAEVEKSRPEQEIEVPEEKEKDGEIQQEEAEFMTESAAELYLSQGLLDDALTIYEKLYRVQKEERYLRKIKEISEKRITQKKVQALTRLLNLIEKKGESRV